ncbi:MAG: DUF2334 domain-containing protein [Verrucomicrobia bacterium]|nr:DUF2334 domain-containing protein [Verrucomicrobiota bacterium]
MNWRVWASIEAMLLEHHVAPLLAVVPDNRDPALQPDPPAPDFWDRVRAWQSRGWVIALHGFQHRYVSRHAGMVALRKKSEFAGLPAAEQREKLRRGVDIFRRERLEPRVWIAPGDTFDQATVALLPEFGIQAISAGYFHCPYLDHRGIAWVPQQLYHFRPAPAGIWTVCYHHNAWTAARLQAFERDLDAYGEAIVSLEDALGGINDRRGGFGPWLCTRPRLSRFLIRAELKAWGWWDGAPRRRFRPSATPGRARQASPGAEVPSAPAGGSRREKAGS